MERMPAAAIAVTVGVDTHLDQHVAAVIDQSGRRCGTKAFAASTRGYAALVTWAEHSARSSAWAWRHRHLRGWPGPFRPCRRPPGPRGQPARPQHPPAPGKSDPIDAQAAARATLAGVATTTPKTREARWR